MAAEGRIRQTRGDSQGHRDRAGASKELRDTNASMVSLKAILEVAAERRETLEANLARKEAELEGAMGQNHEEWKREIAARGVE